jgi:4,5-dihydroxyphthalate decarboxylase
MNEVSLTVAFSDYDHVRDLAEGRIRTPGLTLRFLDMSITDVFGRFTTHREWDVSEMGLGKYAALKSSGDEGITAIPVFPSRMFRQSAFFVPASSHLEQLDQLEGCRVGIPEWAQTAGIYARGALQHDVGVELSSIEWVQAGVNEAGRSEKVTIRMPEGVVYVREPEKTLNGMLLEGEVDAVLTAQAPRSYLANDGSVRRLLQDSQKEEEAYWRRTGIFPIMHTVAIRNDVAADHPWIPLNLLSAFQQAKEASVTRALDWSSTKFPIPWVTWRTEQARNLFDGEYWPYGVESNRDTLHAFLQFAYEQGVTNKLMRVEQLFFESTIDIGIRG